MFFVHPERKTKTIERNIKEVGKKSSKDKRKQSVYCLCIGQFQCRSAAAGFIGYSVDSPRLFFGFIAVKILII